METIQGPFEASAAAASALLEGIILRMAIEEMARKIIAGESSEDGWISIIAAQQDTQGLIEC